MEKIMKNPFRQKTRYIISFGLIFALNFSTTAQQQNRAARVEVKNEQGKTEQINLYDGSYALVIGASDYTNGWQKLPGAKNDLIAVKAALTKQDFTVEELIDPTSENLLLTINRFVNKYGLQPNNRLLIYFAGHGYTEMATDGRKFGYIVPVDAPLPAKDLVGFQQQAVTMDDIESAARKIRSKHALFVFDSCFSGTFLNARRGTIPPVITMKATQPVRQFITAGAADQEVPDVSIFRQQFVEGIGGAADRNGDEYVTASELADYLQEKVTNYTRGAQTPLYGKIFDAALDKGDFIFIVGEQAKRDTAKTTPTPVTPANPATKEIETPKRNATLPQSLSVSEFVKTGICVEPETRLLITAEGSINLGAGNRETGPAGKEVFKTVLGIPVPIDIPLDKQYSIEPKFPLGAFLCRFDYEDNWQYCSTSRTLTAERKGCLTFEVNDNEKNDNQGAFRVSVKAL